MPSSRPGVLAKAPCLIAAGEPLRPCPSASHIGRCRPRTWLSASRHRWRFASIWSRHRRRHRRSAWSRHAGPCSPSPASGTHVLKTACRAVAAVLQHRQHVLARLPQFFGVAPTTWRAMIDEEAWPSAQAFTSWAKSVTMSPSIFSQTRTFEPHSFEWAAALASASRACRCAGYCRRIPGSCCCRYRPSSTSFSCGIGWSRISKRKPCAQLLT